MASRLRKSVSARRTSCSSLKPRSRDARGGTTHHSSAGRASGEPTGIGLDTLSGLSYGTSSIDLTGISFLSFVYPGRKWSLAAYRHQWANFALARQVDGLFGDVDGELVRSEDILATTDFQVTNNGLVGAYEVAENLSFGFGVVYFQSEMTSISEEYTSEKEDFFDPNPHTPEQLDTAYFLGGKGSGVSLHAGFLWRPSPHWSVGGYFREGPDLTMEVTETVGPANDELPSGTVELQATTSLHFPAVYGLGAAFRTEDGALTVSFEWDRVRYSSITESLDANVFDPGQIELSDGNELRLGMEYVIVAAKPIVALRLGTWRDPAHGLDSGPEADLFERTIFTGGDDQTHLSGGAGLVLDKVQLDFGFDLSDRIDLRSLSIVYRF